MVIFNQFMKNSVKCINVFHVVLYRGIAIQRIIKRCGISKVQAITHKQIKTINVKTFVFVQTRRDIVGHRWYLTFFFPALSRASCFASKSKINEMGSG
jgi:hypothetical protein